jgi:dihydroorotate dehydrogenase
MTSRIVKEAGLNLAIAAVGGASQPDDVKDFFDAGADAVLFGSAPMYLPNLVAPLKALHPEW